MRPNNSQLVKSSRPWYPVLRSLLRVFIICSYVIFIRRLMLRMVFTAPHWRNKDQQTQVEGLDILSALYRVSGPLSDRKRAIPEGRKSVKDAHINTQRSSKVWSPEAAKSELLRAFEREESARVLAEHVYDRACRQLSAQEKIKSSDTLQVEEWAMFDDDRKPGMLVVPTQDWTAYNVKQGEPLDLEGFCRVVKMLRCNYIATCSDHSLSRVNELEGLLTIATVLFCGTAVGK